MREVTLEPVELHGVDAAVMFADIMLPGPRDGCGRASSSRTSARWFERPIESLDDVRALQVPSRSDRCPSSWRRFASSATSSPRRRPLIGFCGGPFTVAGYLIEGKPTRDFVRTKRLMYSQPETWHELMERLSETFLRYVRAKVDRGADAIQLFDSWVGALSVDDYEEFVAPYSERILGGLTVPTIHFGTGNVAPPASRMAAAGGDVIGLDWRVRLDAGLGAGRLRPRRPGQPRRVPSCSGPWERVEAGTERRSRARRVGDPDTSSTSGTESLPETDPAVLRRLCELVHERTARVAA